MSTGVMEPGIVPGAASANDSQSNDERFMRLALTLGRRNLGHTWPNPAVGADCRAQAAGRSRTDRANGLQDCS